MVQNRVSLAMPQLPSSVQKQGLTIKKKSPNALLVVNFFSPDGRYDDLYLSNYATIYVKDEIFRLPGVGDINYLGERDYSIRAWLDPQKMSTRNITANEVTQAIQDQNVAAAPGQLGQQPADPDEAFQLPTDTLGRLTEPAQFGDIIVKSEPGGSDSVDAKLVRLKDVARVEMGAANYNQIGIVDGTPFGGAGDLSITGNQCARRRQWRSREDGRAAKAFPGRARVRHFLRHHSLHPRIG